MGPHHYGLGLKIDQLLQIQIDNNFPKFINWIKTHMLWIESSFPCFSLTFISIFVCAVDCKCILVCSSLSVTKHCSVSFFLSDNALISSFSCVEFICPCNSSSSFSAFRKSLSMPCKRFPDAVTLLNSSLICRNFLLFSSYSLQKIKCPLNFQLKDNHIFQNDLKIYTAVT